MTSIFSFISGRVSYPFLKSSIEMCLDSIILLNILSRT